MDDRCSKTTHRLKTALLRKVDSDYPYVVEVGMSNIPAVRDKISGDIMHRYLDYWADALHDKKKLKILIADESDYGLSLWQIAPFAGVFTPQERWAILRGDPYEQV